MSLKYDPASEPLTSTPKTATSGAWEGVRGNGLATQPKKKTGTKTMFDVSVRDIETSVQIYFQKRYGIGEKNGKVAQLLGP